MPLQLEFTDKYLFDNNDLFPGLDDHQSKERLYQLRSKNFQQEHGIELRSFEHAAGKKYGLEPWYLRVGYCDNFELFRLSESSFSYHYDDGGIEFLKKVKLSDKGNPRSWHFEIGFYNPTGQTYFYTHRVTDAVFEFISLHDEVHFGQLDDISKKINTYNDSLDELRTLLKEMKKSRL